MFDSIRDRIYSVVKEGVNVFKSDTVTTPQVEDTINRNAGAHILQKYQNDWAEMHDNSEENAKLADKLAVDIEVMHNKCEKSYKSINELNMLLNCSGRPNITQTIDNCITQLEFLKTQFKDVEKGLVQLENIIECLDLQEKQLEHRFQLAMYKEKKLASLECVRQQLVAKHAQFVADFERTQQKNLQERQITFQEAFENDLREYKKEGILPAIPHSSTKSEPALEDIQLDYESNDLDEFLKD